MTKIVFVGSQDYGSRCLKHLIKNKEQVKALVTFPPGTHEIWKDDISELAHSENIPIIITNNIQTSKEIIKEINPDVIFVVGWRTLIPKEIYYF